MKKTLSIFILACISSICAMTQTIEVMYFHGKQRCATCLSIEKYTNELLKQNYAKEIKNGSIKFSVIDISTTQGKKIAKEYKVSWSSLFVVKGNERTDLTQMGFKYAKNQPEEFKKRLKDIIDKEL